MISRMNVVPRSSPIITSMAMMRDPGQQRDEQLPPVLELAELLLAGQQIRAPQQERELGQLGRLELDAADLQPAGRAAGGRRPDEQDHDQPEQRR